MKNCHDQLYIISIMNNYVISCWLSSANNYIASCWLLAITNKYTTIIQAVSSITDHQCLALPSPTATSRTRRLRVLPWEPPPRWLASCWRPWLLQLRCAGEGRSCGWFDDLANQSWTAGDEDQIFMKSYAYGRSNDYKIDFIRFHMKVQKWCSLIKCLWKICAYEILWTNA